MLLRMRYDAGIAMLLGRRPLTQRQSCVALPESAKGVAVRSDNSQRSHLLNSSLETVSHGQRAIHFDGTGRTPADQRALDHSHSSGRSNSRRALGHGCLRLLVVRQQALGGTQQLLVFGVPYRLDLGALWRVARLATS
jgi:hypothetical protein